MHNCRNVHGELTIRIQSVLDKTPKTCWPLYLVVIPDKLQRFIVYLGARGIRSEVLKVSQTQYETIRYF